jgi:hypothetical protein
MSYLVVPLVLAAVALLGRQYWTAGVAVAATALGAGHSGLNRVGRATEPYAGACRQGSGGSLPRGISVLSWNTQYWDQDSPDLYEFLTAKDADIHVLQERLHGSHYSPRQVPDLARLREEFPGHHIAAAGELITLSRFPIVGAPRPATDWTAEYHAVKVLRSACPH